MDSKQEKAIIKQRREEKKKERDIIKNYPGGALGMISDAILNRASTNK